jgi:hypothetical protein
MNRPQAALDRLPRQMRFPEMGVGHAVRSGRRMGLHSNSISLLKYNE